MAWLDASVQMQGDTDLQGTCMTTETSEINIKIRDNTEKKGLINFTKCPSRAEGRVQVLRESSSERHNEALMCLEFGFENI